MLETIIQTCKEIGIKKYLIHHSEKDTLELFFVKKDLDLNRKTTVTYYDVTVYRDFEKDGEKMLGSSFVRIPSGYPKEEMGQKLKSAYLGASFVSNPTYELAENNHYVESTSKKIDLYHCLHMMTKVMFEQDNRTDAWINSAEFFGENVWHHIVNSDGLDVTFSTNQISGEYVTQSKQAEDVELYHDFRYQIQAESSNVSDEQKNNGLCEAKTAKQNNYLADFSDKVKQSLNNTKDRSVATKQELNGTMKVILSGQYVSELMSYYVSNASAQMMYAGYSEFELEQNVQENGTSLNIRLHSHEPYCDQGIRKEDMQMIEAGVLKGIHGDLRFSYYMNQKPTGVYDCVQLQPGNITMDEMKKDPYLHIVAFSDFQVDNLSGFFGGEIRLAYYYDGTTTKILTGGTVSGNLTKQGQTIVCSKETQSTYSFEGPLAVSVEDVTVG